MAWKSASLFECVIILSVVFVIADGYRPVIIVHGLFDGPMQFTQLASFINVVRKLFYLFILFINI